MGNMPQLLKGFRDFLPAEKRARDFVVEKIKIVFERFGFEPIETPTLEYASLLLGKYGNEADKLVYHFTDRGERDVALRYDQTVPTARVLAQHQHELPKYFRRYQIQNVFRADKPQKGRYREFMQCDADIFGATSPLADAEILAVFYAIYAEVGLTDIQIAVNDRQTLTSTLTPFATPQVSVYSIIQSIDKLDKLPETAVISELTGKGLSDQAATEALSTIKQAVMSDNLERIVTTSRNLGIPETGLLYTPTLARGLDYYTGLIFESNLPGTSGSLGGGGRYDNLIGQLANVNIPAVGFGLGFDRTVEAVAGRQLLSTSQSAAKVLVTVFDITAAKASALLAAKLRQADIPTELYPATDKIGKQFKHADQKGIPLALVLGPEEIDQNLVTLKDLRTGDQKQVSQDQIILSVNEALGTRH